MSFKPATKAGGCRVAETYYDTLGAGARLEVTGGDIIILYSQGGNVTVDLKNNLGIYNPGQNGPYKSVFPILNNNVAIENTDTSNSALIAYVLLSCS